MKAASLAYRSADARPAAAAEIDIDLERFERWLGSCADAAAWPCPEDSVRAQLESVVYRLPPPGPEAVPRVIRPVTSTARRIEQLTRRAEAAEARVRELLAQIADEQASVDALSRRFGRLPHESFMAFVARLGMTAKAVAALRAKAALPPAR